MRTLEITSIGNAVGIILPKEILERLCVEPGDTVCVLETPRGIEITSHNPEFAIQMEQAERIMREDHEALKKLAG